MIVRFAAARVFVVFDMFDQLVPSVVDSHLTTVPVCPLNVRVVLLVPVQTVAAPETVPGTVAELTVMVTVFEAAGLPVAHTAFEVS